MRQAGKMKKGDGKEAHHIKPHASGGSNDLSNIRAAPRSENRAWRKKDPQNYGKLQGKAPKGSSPLKRAIARRNRARKG